MKLKNKSFEDMIVGAEKEMDFSIDSDNHLIFEILRDKMYKDKIGSICREVMSNCRDANRESGSTENIKVTIIEPNQLVYVGHQSVAFKDNGIGITPDRMADIYVKYASSTKRATNDQTGGFGLGAKTPFAYNDTFTVVTVCDYEGKRMKYYYTALIDSSRKGKMVLFDSEEVDEPTGTEVIVPIKTPSDRLEFEKKCIFYSKYWGCVDYENFQTTVPENKIHRDYPEYMIVSGSEPSLLIDGIPYPLDDGWDFVNIDMAKNYAIVIKLNTGDVTISANRESIQYDEDTVNLLREKCQMVYDDFVKRFDDFIHSFPTYLDACKFKAKVSNNMFPSYEAGSDDEILVAAIGVDRWNKYMLTEHYDIEDLEYNGKKVVSNISCKHHRIEKVSNKEYHYYSSDKVYKEYEKLPLARMGDPELYYNTGGKSSRRNLTIFDDLDETYFFMFTPLKSSSDKDVAEELEKLEDDFGMEFKQYSDVKPMPLERTRKKIPATKVSATEYRSWYNDPFELYVNKETKELCTDEESNDKLDLDKYCFLNVDRTTTRLSWYSRDAEDVANFVKSHGWTVILVSQNNYTKRVEPTEAKSIYDVRDLIHKKNRAKWLKQGEQYLIRRAIDDTCPELVHYIDVLPSDMIPQTVKKHSKEDMIDAYGYGGAYHHVASEIKMNRTGITKKLNKRLSKYPLLKSFIRAGAGEVEEKAEKILEYIKQVDNYEN